jgi:hypothetical protein
MLRIMKRDYSARYNRLGMMNILSWDDSTLYSNEIDEDMGNCEDKG